MSIFIGILVVFLSYLPASQLWEIYKRERALNKLIKDRERNSMALKSNVFLSEQESHLEQQLKSVTASFDYPTRIEFFESVDKSATRRTIFIWGGVWIVLLFVLYVIGAGYFIAAITLAAIGGAKNLSEQGTLNALLQYRLLLKTFVDWDSKDAPSLTNWIQQNIKYEAMVQMVKVHTIEHINSEKASSVTNDHSEFDEESLGF